MSASGEHALEVVALREEVERLKRLLDQNEKEPLRIIWKKLVEIEAKVDALKAPATQATLPLATGKKKTNPNHVLLQGRLIQAWLKAKGQRYSFASGRDSKGVAGLLKRGMTNDELVARWEYAIKNGCDSIFNFEMNFNRYVPVSATSRPQVAGGTDLYEKGTT